MTGERDWLTWVGLGVVGAAAAVMSFAALSDLARLCGITAVIGPEPGVPVAWLLPVTVDVLAAVATRVWLQRRVSVEAEHFARGAAWAAIGATVLGNAAHGVLQGAGGPPGWWAAMLVSAVPAAALGALVHLAVLVGRGAGEPGDGETSAVVADPFAALYRHLAAAEWERLAADQGEAASLDPSAPFLSTRTKFGQAKLIGSTLCSTIAVGPAASSAARVSAGRRRSALAESGPETSMRG